MLTINADAHPIMKHMHKPDPKLPANQQNKRMVVVLEPDHWDEWLVAPLGLARQQMTVAPASVFRAGPDPDKSGGAQAPHCQRRVLFARNAPRRIAMFQTWLYIFFSS